MAKVHFEDNILKDSVPNDTKLLLQSGEACVAMKFDDLVPEFLVVTGQLKSDRTEAVRHGVLYRARLHEEMVLTA